MNKDVKTVILNIIFHNITVLNEDGAFECEYNLTCSLRSPREVLVKPVLLRRFCKHTLYGRA